MNISWERKDFFSNLSLYLRTVHNLMIAVLPMHVMVLNRIYLNAVQISFLESPGNEVVHTRKYYNQRPPKLSN